MAIPEHYRLPQGSRLRAATLFGWLAIVFGAVFATIVSWLILDQNSLQDSVSRLVGRTLPQSIEQQRLARNIETLRLEGERVLNATDAQSRQQAMFVVSLLASHPSVLGNSRARDIANETELFLARSAREGRTSESAQAEWTRISRRLSLAADDITIDGVNLARGEVEAMAGVIESAQGKLLGALVLTLAFIVALLLLIHRLLIKPLQRIDKALARLGEQAPAIDLRTGALHEICSVKRAILQLHEMLQQHAETREELERLASTDALTGLYNRRHFMNLAAGEVARAQRYGRLITVGLANLDHFKRVNDEFGHAAGDIALKAFADLVRGTLRNADLAGRYGGEEFAFIFPETSPEEAAVLGNRLRASLESLVIVLPGGDPLRITLSIGVADASAVPIEQALRLADEALYEAKASGRNTVVLRPMAGLSILPPDFDH